MRPIIEEWLIVPGHADYEVSSWGQVRRRTAYRSTSAGYILKPERQKSGHLLVRLGVKRLQPKAVSIHRLVALAFIGPQPSPDHLVAHDDGVPSHNWPDNLFWRTHLQNMADRRRHGTDPAGERNPNASLTDLQVQLIRAHHAVGGTSQAALSRLFDVSDAHISRIVSGAQRRQAGGYL